MPVESYCCRWTSSRISFTFCFFLSVHLSLFLVKLFLLLCFFRSRVGILQRRLDRRPHWATHDNNPERVNTVTTVTTVKARKLPALRVFTVHNSVERISNGCQCWAVRPRPSCPYFPLWTVTLVSARFKIVFYHAKTHHPLLLLFFAPESWFEAYL